MRAPVADRYPARADVPWDDLGDARVVLAIPRRRGRVESLLARLVPGPRDALVSLEGRAARFWRLADGTRALAAIVDELRAPGDEEVDARVRALAEDLARRGFLALHDAPAPARDARKGLGPAQGFRRLACRRCRVEHPVRAPPGAWWACPRCRRPQRVPRG